MVFEDSVMPGKQILWVEDDQDLVMSFKERFEREGWILEAAFSPEEAKAVGAKVQPDLIIMDVIMDADAQHGYSVIESLRGYPHLTSVPIIVFTSLPDRWGETSATREDFLSSDAAEFVDKSGGPDALIETIRKYLST
jgi:CheY-like chemotaxis protein